MYIYLSARITGYNVLPLALMAADRDSLPISTHHLCLCLLMFPFPAGIPRSLSMYLHTHAGPNFFEARRITMFFHPSTYLPCLTLPYLITLLASAYIYPSSFLALARTA